MGHSMKKNKSKSPLHTVASIQGHPPVKSRYQTTLKNRASKHSEKLRQTLNKTQVDMEDVNKLPEISQSLVQNDHLETGMVSTGERYKRVHKEYVSPYNQKLLVKNYNSPSDGMVYFSNQVT